MAIPLTPESLGSGTRNGDADNLTTMCHHMQVSTVSVVVIGRRSPGLAGASTKYSLGTVSVM